MLIFCSTNQPKPSQCLESALGMPGPGRPAQHEPGQGYCHCGAYSQLRLAFANAVRSESQEQAEEAEPQQESGQPPHAYSMTVLTCSRM